MFLNIVPLFFNAVGRIEDITSHPIDEVVNQQKGNTLTFTFGSTHTVNWPNH